MKKRLICILACLMTILTVSCGSKAEDVVVMPEVPDASSTVEKIINNEDIIDIPTTDTEVSDAEEEAMPVDVTIYYVRGSYSEFQVSDETLNEGFDASDLLSKLVLHNIVPASSKVLGMEVVTEADKTRTINLDLDDSFKQYLDTMSDSAEEAILASITDTFLYNYDATRMYITVSGKTLKTNTGEYTQAFEWAERPLKNNK